MELHQKCIQCRALIIQFSHDAIIFDDEFPSNNLINCANSQSFNKHVQFNDSPVLPFIISIDFLWNVL